MARFWVCECGEQFEEDGTGGGMGLAGSHLAAIRRAGDRHAMRGLVDLDTGELLVKGLNMNGARASGYVTGKNPPKDDGGGKPRSPAAAARPAVRPMSEEQAVRSLTQDPPKELTRPQQVSNVRGVLETWTFVVPAPAFALFAMGREIIRREDGTEYPMTPDGFQQYFWDAFRTWHEDHMPVLLGLPEEVPVSDAELIVSRVMERINQTTYLQIAKWNGGLSPLPDPRSV